MTTHTLVEIAGQETLCHKLQRDAEAACWALIFAIDGTGGCLDRQGTAYPLADEEWSDLGDAYLQACIAVGYQVDEVGDHDYSKSRFYHDGYHEPIQALYQLKEAVEEGHASDVIYRDPRLQAALARAKRVLELCHPTPGVEA